MSLTRKIYRTWISLCFLFLSTASNAELLEAATAHWSPYAMLNSNQQLQGISVDVLKEIIKRSKNEVIVTLQPTNRLHQLFDDNKIDMNFADSPLWNKKTPAPDYVFSEPYTTVYEYIYFLEPNYIEVTKPSDLSGNLVGIARGYYYEQYQELFEEKVIHRHEAYSNQNLIALLSINRVDAAFFDDVLFNFLIKSENFEKTKFKRGARLSEAPLGIKLRKEKIYLLEGFNQAIAEMKSDGSIKKIINSYIE